MKQLLEDYLGYSIKRYIEISEKEGIRYTTIDNGGGGRVIKLEDLLVFIYNNKK